MRPTLVVAAAAALGCVVACGAEPARPQATPAAPGPEPAPPAELTDAAAPDTSAEAPSADARAAEPDAADAGAAALDAGARDAAAPRDAAATPEAPLVLKGVRRCTAEEERDDACVEGKKRGLCLEGYCVTDSTCNRYCAATGARTRAACWTDPKECAGVPECVRVLKETNAQCEQLRRRLFQDCLAVMCPTLRTLDAH